jgi:glycosyltransferase involved in cell wall biosynthesis
MRINFILPTVDLGGGIRVIAIHAAALARKGHVVTLISQPDKVEPLRRRVKGLLRGNGWQSGRQVPPSHLDGSGLDHRVLEQRRPVVDADVPDGDVVVATWWETAEWVSRLGPSKGAKTYFIQAHETFPNQPIGHVRATYRLPMHRIVIARWLAQLLKEEYGAAEPDLVPNSVDHAQFHAAERGKQVRPTVGFLYNEAFLKGVDVVLAVLERMRRTRPDLRALCFGSRPPSAAIPLPDWVEFRCAPKQHEIREIYASCDVWLSASRSEGFNLPAMEAMACRTPVVATRTGWPHEAILTGRNGALVNVDDESALLRAASLILSLSDADWKRMSACAAETVASSSWEASSNLFEAALMRAFGSALPAFANAQPERELEAQS